MVVVGERPGYGSLHCHHHSHIGYTQDAAGRASIDEVTNQGFI